MKAKKTTTIKIQQGQDLISVILLAFYPNLRSGKNRGFAIVPNDGTILINEEMIHPDETGKYLYINELALPFNTRRSLHRQSMEMNAQPLIFDEHVITVKFMWE
jgi:hypothetical protein